VSGAGGFLCTPPGPARRGRPCRAEKSALHARPSQPWPNCPKLR